MKLTNEDLIEICNAIDAYDNEYDILVTDFTKRNLKSLLLAGADPYSSNFKERFHDEYHLYRKARHDLGYLQ